MSREQLIAMARHNMTHARDGTIEQADTVMRVPAHNYYDPDRYAQELDRVFRRMPLLLAISTELAESGDFKTVEAAGVPVLMVRHSDGTVRAFINSCRHRGAQVVTEPRGNAKRFSCPYHAWTYDHGGDLIAVYQEQDFGAIDKPGHGLVPLPAGERAGLVWVSLTPDPSLDLDTFLCGYDDVLGHFGFENWSLYAQQEVAGPNWKIAYDGYMDLYHLPVLHRQTFGAKMPNQALYYRWGPHQRVASPDPGLLEFEDQPEDSWSTSRMLASVWTIFPHVSIAGFGGGGRSVMISQLFPGKTPLESRTVQNYVMQKLPETDEDRAAADEQFKLLEYVVSEEDYATGIRQQQALMSRGPGAEVLFGRNEGGGQHFHRFVDRLLETDDQDLPRLFQENG